MDIPLCLSCFSVRSPQIMDFDFMRDFYDFKMIFFVGFPILIEIIYVIQIVKEDVRFTYFGRKKTIAKKEQGNEFSINMFELCITSFLCSGEW